MPASHISRDFESELHELRTHLLAMGARCERSVQLSLAAFIEGSAEMTAEVKELDRRIDRDEMEIDELALRILALRQPVAHDLRLIATALKLVTDLERIGDEAVNIAERAEEAEELKTEVPYPHLREMANLTQQMLRNALDAFVNADVDRAKIKVLRLARNTSDCEAPSTAERADEAPRHRVQRRSINVR